MPSFTRPSIHPRDGALVVDGVTHRFGDRLVLDRVDLVVPSGRVIGLLGPNGAGKTTLIWILFGAIEPEVGTVWWHDRPATGGDRSQLGYMPQERGLYREMKLTTLDPTAVEFLTAVVLDPVAAGGTLVVSSHQPDLVEGLCESISMIDPGRVVLEGDVSTLKRESPDRYLCVDALVEPDWLAGLRADIESADHRSSRGRSWTVTVPFWLVGAGVERRAGSSTPSTRSPCGRAGRGRRRKATWIRR